MKTFTADDSTLLALLRAWEAVPPSLAAYDLYNAAIAYIDERVRQHVAEVLAESVAAPASATIQPTAAEPVGEAGAMPGTSGFTMACFKADAVPVGTKLFTAPIAPADAVRDARNEALEEAATLCDQLALLYPRLDVGYDNGYTTAVNRAAVTIRALKSTPKEPAK